MAEGGLRGHGELPLAAEINVTSLVDVAFVLLIIIMLTAPIMQGGVDVQLPQTEARSLRPDDAAVVAITESGEVSLNGTPLATDDLLPALEAVVAAGPTIVYVRADARVDYGQVAKILAEIRAAGVPNLALVSERVTPP